MSFFQFNVVVGTFNTINCEGGWDIYKNVWENFNKAPSYHILKTG